MYYCIHENCLHRIHRKNAFFGLVWELTAIGDPTRPTVCDGHEFRNPENRLDGYGISDKLLKVKH